MDTVRCMVVDDDPMASTIIQTLIGRTEFLRLEEVCATPIEASGVLHQKSIDLMFLDIEMPEMNGLELIGSLERTPEIILVSAKKDYVEDAFEKEVADYLIKPVSSYPRFLKAVNKAVKRMKKTISAPSPQRRLFIRMDSLLQSIDLNDILWVQAYGDFIKVCTSQKTHTVLGAFKTIREKLPAHEFVQIHRSYIVRLDKVVNIDQSNLQVAKKILPVSKSFKQGLMERIKTL